jgi:hypothetical protein
MKEDYFMKSHKPINKEYFYLETGCKFGLNYDPPCGVQMTQTQGFLHRQQINTKGNNRYDRRVVNDETGLVITQAPHTGRLALRAQQTRFVKCMTS